MLKPKTHKIAKCIRMSLQTQNELYKLIEETGFTQTEVIEIAINRLFASHVLS